MCDFLGRRGGSQSGRDAVSPSELHETLIEIEFEEADGATTVHLTHYGLWGQDAADSHEEGWGVCFDNLGPALAIIGG